MTPVTAFVDHVAAASAADDSETITSITAVHDQFAVAIDQLAVACDELAAVNRSLFARS